MSVSELNRFARNKKYSQHGEEGMIAEMARRLGVGKEGWFVELGAGNGIALSNSRGLAELGWNGLFIEGHRPLYEQLLKNAAKFPNIRTHNGYIDCEPGTTLDDIMGKYQVPNDFDILSLDIDGNDYWVWKSLTRTPKIMVVEFNSNYPNTVSKAIKYDPSFRFGDDDYHGASARAMFKLGTQKGYKLVAQLAVNMFFVRNDLAKPFIEFPIGQIGMRRTWKRSKRNMVDV